MQNLISRESILESHKLAELYSSELRGQGLTPKMTLAVASGEQVLRAEFQNGQLNKIALPFARMAKWARLFPAGTLFDVEFAPGRVSLDCGSSRIVFLDRSSPDDAGQSSVPAICFDDANHSRLDFQPVMPADMASLAAGLKSQKQLAQVAKLRAREIAAKIALKAAAAAVCAQRAQLASVSPADALTEARAWRALRNFARATCRDFTTLPDWLSLTEREEMAPLLAAHETATARAADYKPRSEYSSAAQRQRKDRAAAVGQAAYALRTALGRALTRLYQSGAVVSLPFFGRFPMAWRSLAGAAQGYRWESSYHAGRLAVRRWPAQKQVLATDYLLALQARRKAATVASVKAA